MRFYINNQRQPEAFFWNSLHGIASEREKCMLLDGNKLRIGGILYYIEFVE